MRPFRKLLDKSNSYHLLGVGLLGCSKSILSPPVVARLMVSKDYGRHGEGWAGIRQVEKLQSMLFLLRSSPFFLNRCFSNYVITILWLISRVQIKLWHFWSCCCYGATFSEVLSFQKHFPLWLAFWTELSLWNLCSSYIQICLTLFNGCEEEKIVAFLNRHLRFFSFLPVQTKWQLKLKRDMFLGTNCCLFLLGKVT